MADNFSNINLKRSGERFYWNGNLCGLKRFVSEELHLSGKWRSPGGEVKTFTAESSSLKIKWQGITKKWITVLGEPNATSNLMDIMKSWCDNTESFDHNDRIDQANESCEFSPQKETDCLAEMPIDDETDDRNKYVANDGEALDTHNHTLNRGKSANLVDDLSRLIDKLPKEISKGNTSADQSTSTEISEIKLELAMLWATVNLLENKGIQNRVPTTQDVAPLTKSTGTQTIAEDMLVKKPYENHPCEVFNDQLNSYRATQKAKFESLKPNFDQGRTRKATNPKHSYQVQDKTRKTTKTKHSPQAKNNKINELERIIKDVKQENESLKTIMKIQKDDFNKALKEKDDNGNQHPWQVFKPKQTINLESNRHKRERKWQNQESNFTPTSNQFEVLDNQNNEEVAIESDELITAAIEDKPNSKLKSKSNNPKSTPLSKEHDRSTVIIGDSLLKGLRQRSITKATKTKTLIKCFPGAKISDLKHYCIPVLNTKPRQAIVHCGTNDLHARNPQDITKQMEELCDHIVDNCPDIHITVSSLITRNDDKEKKATEVNTLLQLLCLKKNFRFLLHANIDKKCLNHSGLHLNKFGDSILAKNFIETIKHF